MISGVASPPARTSSRTSAAGSWRSGETSLLPQPTVQTNVSFSRKGVIRGLHFHERGQDDLFVCLTGTARVVILDRETGEAFAVDIGNENPVGGLRPGPPCARVRGAHRLLFCYHVTREYDPADPDEQSPLERPARRGPVEHGQPDPVGAGRSRPDQRRRRPTRRRARGGLPRAALNQGASWTWRSRSGSATCRISCCTPPPGRMSTAPRPTRQARPG